MRGDISFKPFAVGEFWDSELTIADWLAEANAWSDNPIGVFDFPLRWRLRDFLRQFWFQAAPMKKKTIEFSSHTGNLALMRGCVRDFLNGYPFSEKERLLMVLGVDEACTNIIRYAYRLRDDQLIALSMEGLRTCVRVRVRDYGEHVLPHAMKGRSHDIIRPGGLGLYLIRKAFDEVDYLRKRRGTELVLIKNLE